MKPHKHIVVHEGSGLDRKEYVGGNNLIDGRWYAVYCEGDDVNSAELMQYDGESGKFWDEDHERSESPIFFDHAWLQH